MAPLHLGGLAAALGIGLLIGVERERAHGARESMAGVRTFTLVSLLGALAALLESTPALLVFALIVAGFAAIAYRRFDAGDPGLTTEVALVVTYMLGALAMSATALAAGLAVLVTILLLARSRLHDFVRHRLTAREVADGLTLAAAALIVLPLLPDRPVDPWGLLNLRLVFLLAVLFMAINAVGYVALRALGTRRGLPLAGFLGGFVSSSATHSAMGARARVSPAASRAAVAGAALSSIATVLQLAALLAVTSVPLLETMALPLALAGGSAVLYGGFFMWHAQGSDDAAAPGRAFSLAAAVGFALLMGTVMAGSALLVHWLGPQGAVVGSALAGFADAHAGAVSAGALHRNGDVDVSIAGVAVLAAFTTNALTKAGISAWSGGRAFALRIVPGLVLMVAAAWSGLLLERIG
ncbi:MAG: hypothetical protein NAOJABEB_01454 [Steroidobacteraceae bacterium]|nr:hypothetical protein [Steroidobacteraceae bacterium]